MGTILSQRLLKKSMSSLAYSLQQKGIDVGDIVFYINSKCNLRCKHCYVGNELLSSNFEYSYDDFRYILGQFAQLDRLTLLGGEPLLHSQVNAILQYVGSRSITEKRVTTNLTCLRDEHIQSLVDSGFRICVSLDGVDQFTNDLIRGKGTFDTVINNLRLLRSHTNNIEITHTLSKLNVSTFEQFVTLLRDIGIRRLNLHRMNARGNALLISEEVLSPTEWRAFISKLETMRGKNAETINVRYELGFATESEYEELKQADGYRVHGVKSFYVTGNRGRIVLYPDRRVYISSEAFGTEAFIGFLETDNIFHFNESSMNEIALSQQGLEIGPIVNPLLKGDENFPKTLSVSYRKDITI
jgi:MoaA/NifB/PqqE/SkfB family radical SAM enzyme